MLCHQADGDSEELRGAKATSLQDDILALCKLHGFTGTPTLEKQLKAVDTEYHQLKEQDQSGKADYVQTLYIWLSKRAGKVLGRRSVPSVPTRQINFMSPFSDSDTGPSTVTNNNVMVALQGVCVSASVCVCVSVGVCVCL